MTEMENVETYLRSNHIDYAVTDDGTILAGNSVEEKLLEMVATYCVEEFDHDEDFLKTIKPCSTMKSLGIDKFGVEILIAKLNEEYDAKWKYASRISGKTTLRQIALDFKAYLTKLRIKESR